MSIITQNNFFRTSSTPFATGFPQSRGFGFPANSTPGLLPFEAFSYFKMMQFMQLLQSSFGAFGGQAATTPQSQARMTTSAPSPTQPRVSTSSPQISRSEASKRTSTPKSTRPSTKEEIANVEEDLEKLSKHWVKVLPGGHENPQGLMMRLVEGGRSVPYDPNTPAKDIAFLMLDTNHRAVAGVDTVERYWDARTPDGLDRSKLSVTTRHAEQDPTTIERYNDDIVRRMVVDVTASEIYPGGHIRSNVPDHAKKRMDLYATYSSLNSFDSPRHKDKSPEEQQALHESAKFAIASANFLESGGSFDDKALDAFLSETLNVRKLESDSADGPRGERLAKLGEVTKAIIDGKIDLDDAIESGIVPDDQISKFDASVLSVESGKIGADVSKVTEESTDSEIEETVAKAKTIGGPSNPISKNIIREKV